MTRHREFHQFILVRAVLVIFIFVVVHRIQIGHPSDRLVDVFLSPGVPERRRGIRDETRVDRLARSEGEVADQQIVLVLPDPTLSLGRFPSLAFMVDLGA